MLSKLSFQEIKKKASSDTGAVGTVETVLLIALAVLAVMMIKKYIWEPMEKSSIGIGNEIKEMNPE